MTMLTLTTGSAFIMWLGEQITERGIGNGMSLIIFVGIVVGLPSAIQQIYSNTFCHARLDRAADADHHSASSWSRWWPSSCWWSAASAAFRCSTPSA